MKIIFVLAAVAALAGGPAFAQDATTRGGASSSAPSTPQNSPATGPTTPSGGATSAPSGSSMGGTGMNNPSDRNNPPGSAMDRQQPMPRTGESAAPPSQSR